MHDRSISDENKNQTEDEKDNSPINGKYILGGVSSLSASAVFYICSVYHSVQYDYQMMEFISCKIEESANQMISIIGESINKILSVSEEHSQMTGHALCEMPTDNSPFFKSSSILLGALGAGLVAYGVFGKKNSSRGSEIELKDSRCLNKTSVQNK